MNGSGVQSGCARIQKSYLVPKLLDFRWPGTNLLGAADSLREPEHLAGERFSDTAEPRPTAAAAAAAGSLTDSLELDELGAGDGGSSFNDNLKTFIML